MSDYIDPKDTGAVRRDKMNAIEQRMTDFERDSENNKGFYQTTTELATAYPSGGQDGWYIHLGDTNTVWYWDTSAWVDSGVRPSGKTILNGVIDPVTADGEDGDFYINTVTMFIFGAKASGAWPAGVAMNGVDGADGTDGADGVDAVVLDEDDFASNSSTQPPSQQSVSAFLAGYADNREFVRLLPNADFSIAQEGTSFAAMVTAQHICDVWRYTKTGTMVHDGSQITMTDGFTNGIKLDCTTAVASIGAGDKVFIRGVIEGYDFRQIAQRDFQMAFTHAHTKTGTYCVAFRNSGDDRTYVAEYTQVASGAEEVSTIAVAASPSAGTWGAYANDVGLRVFFIAAAGATHHTVKDAWQTGTFLATSNQVNACDSTANDFVISNVIIGNAAVVSGGQNHQERLAHVHRYYEEGDYYFGVPLAHASVVQPMYSTMNFMVPKRVVPDMEVASGVGTGSAQNTRATGCGIGRSNIVANNKESGTYIADARF